MPRFPNPPLTISQGVALQGPAGPQGPPGTSYIHRYTYQFLAGSATTPLGVANPLIVGSINWDLTNVFSTVPAGLKCIWRGAVSTSNAANPVFIDMFDVSGLTTGGTPGTVIGSQFQTSNINTTAFTIDLSSAFSTLTNSGVFQARLWLNPTAGGQQAVATLAKLDLEWTP